MILHRISAFYGGKFERFGTLIGYYKHTIYYPYGLFVFVFIKVDKLQPEYLFGKILQNFSRKFLERALCKKSQKNFCPKPLFVNQKIIFVML